jgi:hypothetical protein
MATQLGEQADGTFSIEKIDLPAPRKPVISNSQIETMEKCGEQYFRRYIKRDKTAIGLSLIVGSAVDYSVTANLQSKIEKGSYLNEELIREFANKEFDRRIKEAAGELGLLLKMQEKLIGEQAAIQAAREKAIRLALLHYRDVAPKITPMYVQRVVGVVMPGMPFDLNGIIDIQEPDSVRDTKAKKASPPKGTADVDDQLTMYGMLLYLRGEEIPKRFILDCLVDTKTPKYVPDESTRQESDFEPLIQRIYTIFEAIKRGVFVPARETDWWCGQDWCGYWESCKYVKRAQRPAA